MQVEEFHATGSYVLVITPPREMTDLWARPMSAYQSAISQLL